MSAISIETPIWLESLLAEIAELGQLDENWDSYGARRIDTGCAEAGMNLLKAILDASTPRPSVVPTARGGIQLEWHRGGVDLEIAIESPERMNVSFENARDGTQKAITSMRLLEFATQCVANLMECVKSNRLSTRFSKL